MLGSMGKVACAYDNALMESFWGSMQIELLDRRYWRTRAELATAMFEWIEAFYNPIRSHSGLDYRSPVEFERLHKTANPAARSPHQNRPENRLQVNSRRSATPRGPATPTQSNLATPIARANNPPGTNNVMTKHTIAPAT